MKAIKGYKILTKQHMKIYEQQGCLMEYPLCRDCAITFIDEFLSFYPFAEAYMQGNDAEGYSVHFLNQDILDEVYNEE